MTDFSSLPATLAAALSKRGYDALTPVQEAVLDETLRGKDLLVSAQTGSGKTVGFGLTLAHDVLDEQGRFGRPATPVVVVIAPTRELALQVQREFDWLFAEAGIVTASAVGGMDSRTERRVFERGAHVVVATPGRLRDHVTRGGLDLSDLQAVVLDEADEMLDLGFSEDLEYILEQTPADRRTLMFSATVPRGITKLAQTYQKDDAHRLKVGSADDQHADISYRAVNVAPSDIEKAVINLLCYHNAQTAIIFANTRAMVGRLTAKFSNRGFSVVSLSGELSQSERTNALQSLRDGRANVCVATDVAARGIDLPGLELVIHADLPSNSETLLHRSGRTGRAGRKGNSILIVPGRQRSKAQRLLKTAKLDAEWGDPPSFEAVLEREEQRIISDPALNEPPSPEEAAFAQQLLEGRTPEQIAAAYLRLYRTSHSTPEKLGAVPERGKKEPASHEDFGPSKWFSLSLGRKDRAEPRWLLPMICRNGGVPKNSIGAIRVQYQETFIEIAEGAVAAMKQELGADLSLEQGAVLTELSGTPNFESSPKGPPAAPKKPFDGPKHRKSRDDRPSKPSGGSYEGKKPKDAGRKGGKPFDKPAGDKPAHKAPRDGAHKAPRDGACKAPRDAAFKDKKSRHKATDAKPRSHDDSVPQKPAGKPKAPHQKRKGATDTSKSFRGGGKPAHKPKGKGKPNAGFKGKGAPRSGGSKGAEARPFRKPSR